jgi:hypothetical protein
MNLDYREVLVCLVTIVAIAAATIVAVGAVATYSYIVHTTSPAREAAYRTPVVVASSIDPCLDLVAARPPTPPADSGLQCPIYRGIDRG